MNFEDKMFCGDCGHQEKACICDIPVNAPEAKPLTWTKESPTVPGWYWVREIPGRSGIPGQGKSYLVSIVGKSPFLRLESAHDQAGFRLDINLYNMGEWAGPIEVPE